MGCLFCNKEEKAYKPHDGVDFICSQCVQMLIAADQAELKRAYDKAIEKGYQNKASAIESFLIPEEINVRETQKHKRGLVRARSVRAIRPSRNQNRPQPATV